jgi:small subunit ribosomal protein S6
MKKYEFMLILDPTVTEDERNETIESIGKMLKSAKAKITKEDVWGDKKMAYTINKSDRGFYILYYIEIDGEELKEITKLLNLEKHVWRHMFVKIED